MFLLSEPRCVSESLFGQLMHVDNFTLFLLHFARCFLPRLIPLLAHPPRMFYRHLLEYKRKGETARSMHMCERWQINRVRIFECALASNKHREHGGDRHWQPTMYALSFTTRHSHCNYCSYDCSNFAINEIKKINKK